MSNRSMLSRQVPPWLIWVAVVAAFVACGQWLQAGVHLNHDVSWIAHSARWLLQGRKMGTDVFDATPPMAWLLSLPAASFTSFGLMSEPAAVRFVFWGYFLVSAALVFHILSKLDVREEWASTGWRVAFVVIATLAPAFSFGQREFASVLFAMPYLALTVLRMQKAGETSNFLGVSVGLLAGVGLSIKPYFLAVPLLLESWLIIRLGWRSIVRLECVVLGSTVLAYLLSMLIFMPEYVRSTVPLVRSVYWAYDAADFSFVLARYRDVMQPAVFGGLIALLTRTWTPQHTAVLLGTLGYSVSYLVQAKGFVYQAYPILVCAFVFLGVSIGSGLSRAWRETSATQSSIRYILTIAVLLLAWLPVKQVHDSVLHWYVQYNIAWGKTGQFREAVISAVEQFAPSRHEYFFALSTHPFPGFPTASYTAADWSGRAATQFIIPAYARRHELTDPNLRETVEKAAELQRQMVIQDLKRRPPSIVFVEQARVRLGLQDHRFDDLAFYLVDPDFTRFWSVYEERQPIGSLRVFVRRSGDEMHIEHTK